jgi:hypothetical protein
MTTSRINDSQSTTSSLSVVHYEEATLHQKSQPVNTSNVHIAILPLSNTVFASSSDHRREVTVDPIWIKKSLKSIERNRGIRDKGLG